MSASRRWADLVTAALAALVVAWYGLIALSADSELGARQPADAYYNHLVDGFLHGHAYLDLTPPEGFLKLSNPYDQRANLPFRGGIYEEHRIHDLSYYQGRFYLYFSVVPAVVLFLPYHVLTGAYLSHQAACFVFASVGFLALAATMLRLRRRFFPKLGSKLDLLGVAGVGLVPVLPVVLQRPDVWEVPIVGSYAFWALALLWFVRGLGRAPSAGRAAAMSLAAGLAIGCRPNTLAGAVLFLPSLLHVFREAARSSAWGRCRRWLGAAVVPAAAVGAALLAYNKARFGDFGEFGQKYQLNGDTAPPGGHFRWGFLGYDFRTYFLHPPQLSTRFPYEQVNPIVPLPPGFGACDSTVGLLPSVPFVILALALPAVLLHRDSAERSALTQLCGILALLFAGLALPLCLFFGACVRYETEFSGVVAVMAVLGFWGLLRTARGGLPRLGLLAFGGALAIASTASQALLVITLRTETNLGRAAIAFSHQRWGEAEALYARALRWAPSQSDALLAFGVCAAQQGALDRAEQRFARAVQAAPDSVPAHLDLAYAHLLRHRLDAAAEECRTVLRLQPGFVQALSLAQQIEAARRAAPGVP